MRHNLYFPILIPLDLLFQIESILFVNELCPLYIVLMAGAFPVMPADFAELCVPFLIAL